MLCRSMVKRNIAGLKTATSCQSWERETHTSTEAKEEATSGTSSMSQHSAAWRLSARGCACACACVEGMIIHLLLLLPLPILSGDSPLRQSPFVHETFRTRVEI